VLPTSELTALHQQRTVAEPSLFRAPGRVNLVGEHTDYCDGFCMPAALNFFTSVAISPRSDSQLVLHSVDYADSVSYSVDNLPSQGLQHWSDYIAGVAWAMQQRGIKLSGADLTITGDVPRNAGLSSSASLEVATALALLSLTTDVLSGREVALLCQFAENNYVGAPSGIMDQFISVHARSHHALALDSRYLSFEYVTLPAHLRLVIANSMVKHSVAGSEYAERRAQVEEGVRILQEVYPQSNILKLRDVTLDHLNAARPQMTDVVFRRCRHILTDSQRVLDACGLLRESKIDEFGRLLVEAHASYRDDFGASCEECDILVEEALPLAGCYGSRLTGGGFGGCTVSLVEADYAPEFRDALLDRYRAATGIEAEAWVCEIAGGASQVE
jgi:galactokinase